MKTIVRNLSIYTFAVFLLPLLIPGVHVAGGLGTMLLGGLVLTLLFLILKPILNIIGFPVNMVTLGLFNVFINALLVYLLTVFVTDISVAAFTYQKANVLGFITPIFHFNTFFAYVYTAFVLSVIDGFIRWLLN
jgi:putative membrane protein